QVGRIVSAQNRCTSAVGVGLSDPHNPIAGAVRGYGRRRSRIAVGLRRLRGVARRKALPIRVKRECLQEVGLATEIYIVVPERGSTPDSTNSKRDGLHDLAVVSRMKVAHVIPVDQIDRAFLSRLHQQVRIGLAGLIGKQHYATGTE